MLPDAKQRVRQVSANIRRRYEQLLEDSDKLLAQVNEAMPHERDAILAMSSALSRARNELLNALEKGTVFAAKRTRANGGPAPAAPRKGPRQ